MKKNIAILGVIAAVLVVVWVVYMAFFSSQARNIQGRAAAFFTSLGESSELRKAIFLEASWSGSHLYSDSSLKVKNQPVFTQNDRITDVARNAANQWAISVFHQREGVYEINFQGTLFASSTMPKQSLNLSPDGKKLAFAEANGDPYKVESWHVALFDAAQRATVDMGPGFAALFIDDSTLLVFSQKGVAVQYLALRQSKEGLRTEFPSAQTRVAQSPDRQLLSWIDPKTNLAVVYRVEKAKPLTLKLTDVFTLNAPSSLALTATSLYGVTASRDTGSDVWQYALQKNNTICTGVGACSTPKKVRSFPPELTMIKMIP